MTTKKPSEQKKILTFLLLGHWALNMGDIAIAQATVDDIRSVYPNSRIILESSHPSITNKFLDNLTIIPRIFKFDTIKHVENIYSLKFLFHNFWFVLSSFVMLLLQDLFLITGMNLFNTVNFKAFQDADIVIFVGGDYISENYAYFQRFREIRLAKKLGKKVVIYGQTIGKFSKQKIQMVRRILSMVDTIIVRDEKSSHLLNDYGVQSRIVFNADIAVLLESTKLEINNSLLKDYPIKTKSIGIVPRNTKYTSLNSKTHSEYIESLTQLIRQLIIKKYTVVFFPTNPNDSNVCIEINNRLGETLTIVPTVEYSPKDLKAAFSKLALLISSRMHPLILASGVFTPVFCLGHEFKMKEYLRLIGMESWYMDMESIDNDLLLKKVDEILENKSQISNEIKDSLKKVQLRSAASINEIKLLLN